MDVRTNLFAHSLEITLDETLALISINTTKNVRKELKPKVQTYQHLKSSTQKLETN